MEGKRLLLIIDMQNDFISGALGTPEAQAMLPNLLNKVKNFDGPLALTLDTHGPDYLQTQEGQHLPVEHCIEGTWGWQLQEDLAALPQVQAAPRFKKPTFGSTALADYVKEEVKAGRVSSVELCGLCTDICVISNALLIKAALPELPVYADPNCCAGVTPERHQAALEVMQSCQVQLI